MHGVCRVHQAIYPAAHGVPSGCMVVQAGSHGYLQIETNRLPTAEPGIDLQGERPHEVSPKTGKVVHFSALESTPKRLLYR